MKLPPLLRGALSQWPGFLVALIPSIGLIALFGVMAAIGLPPVTPDCAAQVTSLIRSPVASSGPARVAVARDEACVVTGIGGSRWQVQCVHIVGEGKEVGPRDEVFCIHDDTSSPRVTLRWLSPEDLEITAPNLSISDTRKASYDGIHIDVRFDPDDPAAREQWLQSQGWKGK